MEMRSALNLKPEYVIGRELSWLEFNARVLDEALNPANPIFEQMKFVSIAASNLDEFFMVRVASLWDQIDSGSDQPDASGLTPRMQLAAIQVKTRALLARMYEIIDGHILPELRRNGVEILDAPEGEDAALDAYFEKRVYPVLTPMAVDATRPFPLILSRSLNLGLLLEDDDGAPMFATVQVPSGLPRLVRLPGDGVRLMPLEKLIARYVDRLFEGRKTLCVSPYRITRNADLPYDEEETENLMKEIEESLRKRRWGAAVRLEIDKNADPRLVRRLEEALELEDGEAFFIGGAINPDFFMRELYKLPGFEALKYPSYAPRPLSLKDGESLFERVARGDVLLHHPYDSFETVVSFIRQAASDPRVLAIKQTLYRVSATSPIIDALAEAADSGKQVTVLLELKARFDEENNIHWGRRLEQAGAHVIYGLVGLKTHSKITLVVRDEEDGIKRYVHLATGNYNDVTARIYTDFGLFTANERVGGDASAFFNMLSGYTELPKLDKLVCAPRDLRRTLTWLIDREAEAAREGERAEIFAKMNSLVDEDIIASLYRASMAGVRIRLIVRGICCLRPGLPGVSEHIEVRSIVGRYLEHSRVFAFRARGEGEVYLSSADWMPRNLNRRVELMFPVDDPALKHRVMTVMKAQWRDDTQSREMRADGSYHRIAEHGTFNSQEEFMKGSDIV